MNKNVINKEKYDDANSFLNTVFEGRKVRKVLLVSPPDADASLFRYDTAKRLRYTNYPPYGLGLLANNLSQVGVEVQICNLNHTILKKCIESENENNFIFDDVWKGELKKQIGSFKPDLVGVTCMFTMTHTSFKEVCKNVSTYNIPIAIGGVHVSNDFKRILNDISEVNFVFLKEGDAVFKDFVQVVNKEQDISVLAQCVFNLPNKVIIFEDDKRPNDEYINLAPSYNLMSISDYSKFGTIGAFYCFKPVGTKFATVLSNRGCRARCTFCSVRNFNGPGVRIRSIDSIIDELELLREKYEIGHIMWLDDDLFKDHKRVIRLFDEMARRNLDMTWDATNGVIAASCTDEVIDAAAKSGCIALNIGMESGNPDILRKIVKPGTVKNFLKAAEVLRKYEQIHSSVFLMIGFPDETLSMILDTINVAKEMDLDWYRASVLQPLPNTPIYDSMVEQGLIQGVGSKIRFMGGAYGKQTEMEQGLSLSSPDFEKAFSSIPIHSIPTSEQLTDIWFYMNYHLNFKRIFGENRLTKCKQLVSHLSILSDIISPENGFALYFEIYLRQIIDGTIDKNLLMRLKTRLDTSNYWQDRFKAFNLSIDDLLNQNFEQASAR